MRKFVINVNGNNYKVEVEEVFDEKIREKTPINERPKNKPIEKPAVKDTPIIKKEEKKNVSVSEGGEIVKAPMPGTILKILVKEGDLVKSNQNLLILEAMKMENEIVSPKEGKITKICVESGATVSSGDDLIIIE